MGESIDEQTVIDLIQALTFSRCMEYGEYPGEDVGKEYLVRSDVLINAIKELPPAEPKIGHWEVLDKDTYDTLLCDSCGNLYGTYWHFMIPKFCPNCGSKMENVDKSN